MSKIFCIGFHKTGTSSLGAALAQLGYRVKGPVRTRDPHIAERLLKVTLPLVERYDAFQDNPWPILFRTLDERFPGSKFILTVRDPDAWLKSVVAHFGTRTTPMRQLIYGAGCPLGHEAVYRDRFLKHEREVLEHFRDRPQDLLLLDLKQDNPWLPLCQFLDKPIPDSPFPHINQGKVRKLRKGPAWKIWLRRMRGKLPHG